jgi:hypothetical protein
MDVRLLKGDRVNAQPWEARMAHLEGAFIQVGERLNSMDRRLDSVDRRLESVEQTMNSRFAQVDVRFALIDQRFNWVIGLIVGTWITTMLAILFHH